MLAPACFLTGCLVRVRTQPAFVQFLLRKEKKETTPFRRETSPGSEGCLPVVHMPSCYVSQQHICMQAPKARLARLLKWPGTDPTSQDPSPGSAPANASTPGQAQAESGTPSPRAPSAAPFMLLPNPSSRPNDPSTDPATPYLLALSLFLWEPAQWMSHLRPVLLHLLRFIFTRAQSPVLSSTNNMLQPAANSDMAGPGTDASTEASSSSSASQPASVQSRIDPSAGQALTPAGQATPSSGQADPARGSDQAGTTLLQWQKLPEEEQWQAAAPLLRFFGLVCYLQQQLNGTGTADSAAAAKAQ